MYLICTMSWGAWRCWTLSVLQHIQMYVVHCDYVVVLWKYVDECWGLKKSRLWYGGYFRKSSAMFLWPLLSCKHNLHFQNMTLVQWHYHGRVVNGCCMHMLYVLRYTRTLIDASAYFFTHKEYKCAPTRMWYHVVENGFLWVGVGSWWSSTSAPSCGIPMSGKSRFCCLIS